MEQQRKSGNAGEKVVIRDERGRVMPGSHLNDEGKKAGTLDFKTQWFNFIEKVAKQNDLEPIDIDNEIFAMVLKEMRKGNFQFYKDTKDRLHGKAKESLDLSSDGELKITWK